MSNCFKRRILVDFFAFTLLLVISCSSNQSIENDISTLNQNYFIQDSVKSTPVKISLNWQPRAYDRVKIRIGGSFCSSIEFSSEWMSDSLISLEIDAGSENYILVDCQFELSSFYPYKVSYTLSVDGKYLVNEDLDLYKEPASPFSIHRFSCFLPLFRSSGILTVGSTQFICPEHPIAYVRYRPDCYDSLAFDSSFDIKDQFTLSIESDKNNVIFYDRFLKRGVGKTVKARINEFQKYEILLLESENSVENDSITVTYSCSKFSTNFNFIVQKECPQLKQVHGIIVNFNKKGFPGDTLIVTPTFTNENGEEEYFSEDTEFSVYIRNNCEYADILSPEGELGKFIGEMKQPIKLVILGTPDNGIIGLRVAVIPNNKYGAYSKY